MTTDKNGRPLSETLGTFTRRQSWHRRMAEERPQEPWNDQETNQQEGSKT